MCTSSITCLESTFRDGDLRLEAHGIRLSSLMDLQGLGERRMNNSQMPRSESELERLTKLLTVCGRAEVVELGEFVSLWKRRLSHLLNWTHSRGAIQRIKFTQKR